MDTVKQNFEKNVAIIFALMMMFFAFAGCGKDDDPNNGGDDRTGEPYMVRIELSVDEGEALRILIGFANYNFIEQSGPLKGLPRTEWLFENVSSAVPSPFIGEFELPRYFNKFSFIANVFEHLPDEVLKTKNIHGKVYVNDNLLVSSSSKYGWTCVIEYDSNRKKYVVNYSGGSAIEKDKL